ncbi:MAG: SDR family oxidoreductase [Paracoccaceae bacterium]|nr:SDR family oxidoreductase [Paracoccaceae bacterium]
MKPEATIVTGGSNGIGAAIVGVRAAAGDTVINLDRDEPPADAPGTAMRLDLSDRAALEETLAEATAGHDITRVVNNAGVALLSPIDEFNAEDFDTTMAVNVCAPALIVKHCLPAMKARGFGRIVNIASRAALGKGLRTSYAGSKGALISATRVWALELARDGITVNCIAPGPIGTELFHRVNPLDSPVTRQIMEGIPVGRLGTPEDIAHSVDHFLSLKAGFVTGQTLYVCGGMTIGVVPI